MRFKEYDKKSPCQAVINLTIEIMERLPNGQVTGIPIQRIAKVYSVIGKNFDECKKNVDEFMTKFNNKMEQSND